MNLSTQASPFIPIPYFNLINVKLSLNTFAGISCHDLEHLKPRSSVFLQACPTADFPSMISQITKIIFHVSLSLFSLFCWPQGIHLYGAGLSSLHGSAIAVTLSPSPFSSAFTSTHSLQVRFLKLPVFIHHSLNGKKKCIFSSFCQDNVFKPFVLMFRILFFSSLLSSPTLYSFVNLIFCYPLLKLNVRLIKNILVTSL